MLSWAIAANRKLLSDIPSFSSGDQVKALIDYAKHLTTVSTGVFVLVTALKEK